MKKRRPISPEVPGAPEPDGFVKPTGQFFPWIPVTYVDNMNAHTGSKPFPEMDLISTEVGDLIYVPFDMEGSDKACYLGQVVHKNDGAARVNFVDCHKFAGQDEPEDHCYDDFDGKIQVYMVRKGKGWPSPNEPIDPEEVRSYLRANQTIKSAQSAEKRVEVLEKTIAAVSKVGDFSSDSIRDAYIKVKEGMPSQAKANLGHNDKNCEIVRDFFDVRKKTTDPQSAILMQILARLDKIEDRHSRSTRVSEVAEEVKNPAEEKGDVEFTSMPGDGKCCYWMCWAAGEVASGKKVGEVQYNPDAVGATCAQIIDNGMQWFDEERNKEASDEATETARVEHKFADMAGEDLNEFYTKISNSKRLGQEERWGGHTEAMLYAWRQAYSLVIINADGIKKGMSVEEAREQVVDQPWPNDGRDQITQGVIAVLQDGHYSLLTRGDKGAFQIDDEYQEALRLGLEKILSIQTHPDFSAIARVTDKKRRLEMIREKMGGPPKLATKRKKKKKKKSSGSTGPSDLTTPESKRPDLSWAGRAGGGEWTTVGGSNSRGARRSTPVGRQPTQVSSVVVYTSATEEQLMMEIRNREPTTSNLIQSTRQKTGHIILMTSEEKDAELRKRLPWFREIGLEAKEYFLKDTALAKKAQTGMQLQVKETGICHAYMQGISCKFGHLCKFKCYQTRR